MECDHHYVKRNINADLKGNPKLVWKCKYCGKIHKEYTRIGNKMESKNEYK